MISPALDLLLIFHSVIKQCALERDLELFEAGDATEVGERGLTLRSEQAMLKKILFLILSRTVEDRKRASPWHGQFILLRKSFFWMTSWLLWMFTRGWLSFQRLAVFRHCFSSAWIIDQCFRGDLVKDRTILLVVSIQELLFIVIE